MATYDVCEFENPPFTQKCKYCERHNLEWFRNPVTGKWALYNSVNERHECRPTKRAVDLALPSEDVTELRK